MLRQKDCGKKDFKIMITNHKDYQNCKIRDCEREILYQN